MLYILSNDRQYNIYIVQLSRKNNIYIVQKSVYYNIYVVYLRICVRHRTLGITCGPEVFRAGTILNAKPANNSRLVQPHG